MNDKDIEKFINASGMVNLSEDEKSAIRQSVLNFIANNPARPDIELYPVNQKVGSFWSAMFSARLGLVSSMAMFFVLIAVSVVGGITIGAEKALPGDTLYSVKIGVNEEVRGWLAVSEESKANWEVQQVQRRLEEAEQLVDKGSLDAEIRGKIETNLEANTERVQERIAKFEGKENFNNAAEVSSNLETFLRAHEKILNKLSETKTDSAIKGEIKPIAVKVRSQALRASKSRLDNETKASSSVRIGDQATAKARLKSAEKELAAARKLFKSIETNLNDEAKLQSEIKLEAAQTTIDYGKTKLEAKAYGEALIAFQKSISMLKETRLLVQARNSLNVDIRIDNNVGGDSDGLDEDNKHKEDDNRKDGVKNGEGNPGRGSGGSHRDELKVDLGL